MSLPDVTVTAPPTMSFIGGDGAAVGGGGGGGGNTASDGSGLSVTANAGAPPGTIPAVTLQLTPAANLQLARQEAAAIGTLTAVALSKVGVPKDYATFVGAQVTVSLTSPEGLDALMSVNQGVATALARAGEATAGLPFGMSVDTAPGAGAGPLYSTGPGGLRA